MKAISTLKLVPKMPARHASMDRFETVMAEKARAENEEWFRKLSENSLVGEYILQNGRATYVNPALAKIFGYTQAELVGQDALTVVHPEDRALVAEKLRTRAAGEVRSLYYECRGLRKDGLTIEIQVWGGFTATLEGAPAIIGNILDITERKKSERELRRMSRALLNISRCIQIIKRSKNEPELLESVCRNLVEGGYRMVWVGYAEHGGDKFVRPVAQAGFDDGYVAAAGISWGEDERGNGPTGRSIRTGQVVINRATETDESLSPWREEALKRGYRSSISLPLRDGGRPIGALVAYASESDAFDPEEVELLSELAEEVSFGIETLRTRVERERAAEQLQKLSRAVEQSPASVVITDVHGCIEYANPKFTGVTGYSLQEVLGKNPRVLKSGQTPDSTYRELWETILGGREWHGEFVNRKKDGELYWESASISPIKDAAGATTHFVAVKEDITGRKRTEEALREAHSRLAQSVKALEGRTDEITTLSQFGRMLQSCLNMEEAYRVITAYCQKLFPSFSGSVYLIAASRNFVHRATSWGTREASEPHFAPEDCWALRSGRLHCAKDQANPARCRHMPEKHENAYLCVPLMAQGEAMGILHVECGGRPELPGGDDWAEFQRSRQELAGALAEHIALGLANLQLRDTLRSQSIRDALTGLFNRRYMEESLEREILRAERGHSTIGILLLDIDHFKRYNDTFGHEAGDALLREIGTLLKKQVRGEDIPCRYGGEEFLLIMSGAPLDIAHQRAERFRAAVKQLKVSFHGQALGAITISIGVATYPLHGDSAESVLEAADKALYAAKESGRDRVVLATAEADEA